MPLKARLQNFFVNLIGYHRLSFQDAAWLDARAHPRSLGSQFAMQVRELEAPDHVPYQPDGFPPGYEENELMEVRVLSKIWVSGATAYQRASTQARLYLFV